MSVLDNNIFITTKNNGVYRYDTNGNFITKLSNTSGDKTICSHGNNTYWANNSGVLYNYNKSTGIVSEDIVGGNLHGVATGANYLFWTADGSVRRIDKNTKTIEDIILNVNSWMVFVFGQKIYWTTLSGGEVYSSNFDATQLRVLAVPTTSANAADVDNEFVYYTDNNDGKLLRVSK
jgi:hypothetical protein